MERKPFRKLTEIAAPLRRLNVDTDAIIPGAQLLKVTKGGFGQGLFYNWRYKENGEEEPDFILNKAPYQHAKILLAGHNFACGSSREVAVWALRDYGFRCVIAPSFGNIFYSNALKNGFLPVVIAEDDVERISDEVEASQGAGKVTVDLEKCRVVSPGGCEYAFEVPENYRQAMLDALDPIAATLRFKDDIIAFQNRDRDRRSWAYFGPRKIDDDSFNMGDV
ncbi:3-isopropylmalate dehydratase small subunit [Hyphococcus luteus]|uniref:3-isopropylmalate dehydratase small subunit n=1 Tax=Hyphococcus luteus TaxID=2058213 RepID=A0A2S7K582_9PROT|nr:3-isopropylmalate dehydratase small subunit [Marinicaulis flavus]PQA87652.1 3-isopropylmalate dehydratase small subunit [Marinicaulis flavus]